MKIAAIALASALAAVAGSAQPSFAQSPDQGQYDQNQYNADQNQNQSQYNDQSDINGQSMKNGEDVNGQSMNEPSTTGQNQSMNGNNQDDQFQNPNWRGNRNWRNNRMGSNEPNAENGPEWRHHRRWGMEGERMWHHRMMMMGMMRQGGARFTFGNGRGAHMSVRCPANEPLQACVNAATELLDKIASLRGRMGPNQSGQNGTNGSNAQTSGQGATGGSSSMDQDEGNQPNPINLPGTKPGSTAPSNNLPQSNSSTNQQ